MGKDERRRVAVLLAAGFLLCAGCNGQDTERLCNLVKAVAAKLEGLADGADGKPLAGWQKLGNNLDSVTLEVRVLARLKWDKNLADVHIDVRSENGQVELKGRVHDLLQRRRAVELAESTIGADKVIDLLEIPEREP